MQFGRVGAVGDSASPPHAGGSPLWPVAPNLSLSGVSSASREACQISGLWPGPADCLSGVVVGAAAPGSARPFHRLVCAAAPSPYPSSGLQHAIFDFARGASSTLGQSFVGSSGAPNLVRLAAALPASYLFAGNFHRAGPLSRHLLSRKRAGSLSRHLLSRGQLAS